MIFKFDQKIAEILEELSLDDFRNNQGVSSLTRKYQRQRSSKMGAESKNAKIDSVKIEAGNVICKFKTPTTENGKKYTMTIKIDDFMEWLEDEELDLSDMKYIFENLDVKLHCTCPGFHWQGMRYKMSQIDAAAEPITRADPVWGPRHNNDNLLCKHLQGLVNGIKFWKNPLVSKINKQIKS